MAIMKHFSAQDYELFKAMKHQEDLEAALDQFCAYFCDGKMVSLDFVDGSVVESHVQNILESMVENYHEYLFEYSIWDAWRMTLEDMERSDNRNIDYLQRLVADTKE